MKFYHHVAETWHIAPMPEGEDEFPPIEYEAETSEKLLEFPFIKQYSEDDNFYRYSMSGNTLMAEYKNGYEWWVIGEISGGNADLPLWEPRHIYYFAAWAEQLVHVTEQRISLCEESAVGGLGKSSTAPEGYAKCESCFEKLDLLFGKVVQPTA